MPILERWGRFIQVTTAAGIRASRATTHRHAGDELQLLQSLCLNQMCVFDPFLSQKGRSTLHELRSKETGLLPNGPKSILSDESEFSCFRELCNLVFVQCVT
ncbi:hypothetical protein GOODEAATRI_002891 [Goodea atripinnis]|uniref:Uncharacterized protein n=1 Tax=Goodea atripinnis TaxID=208336 RepID=A0ABV0MNT3_9TELE